MRRTMLVAMIAAGCFGEPERTGTTTVATTVATTSEESSSSDGESSSSEGVEESGSSEGPVDPKACPEWCTGTCDTLAAYFERCRCTNDAICSLGGLTCHDEENSNGHCY